MDNVIFLGPGGKTVYSGNPIDATDYFEMLGFHAPGGVNRADYFMDLAKYDMALNQSNTGQFSTSITVELDGSTARFTA